MAGRPAGVPNKNKDFLLKRLQEMYGEDFNPIMMAAKNAVEMNKLAELTLTQDQMDEMEGEKLISYTEAVFSRKKECVSAFEKIGQYINPKLKAIELSGEIEVSSHEAWLKELANE